MEPVISLCMIVKNEERYLKACLESVKQLVYEMIIVDTGSTDRTVEIAKSYGAKVFYYTWENDFSKARNYSLKQATGDWILLMDGDDLMSPVNRDNFIKLLMVPDIEAYLFPTINYLGLKPSSDQVVSLNVRLIKNRKGYFFSGAIHEQIIPCIQKNSPEGEIRAANIPVHHYGYLQKNVKEKEKRKRNISILEKILEDQPDNAFHLFNIGNEFFALRDYNQAYSKFKKSLKIAEVVASGIKAKLLLRLVLTCKNLKRYDEALEYIAQGLKEYPRATDFVFLRGVINTELNRFTIAIRDFLTCLDMGEPHLNQAFLLGVGTWRPYLAMGDIYNQFEDYEESLKAYLQVLKFSPNHQEAFEKIGKIIIKGKLPEWGIDHLLKILKLPQPHNLAVLADILIKEKRYSDALVYLNRLLNFQPENDQTLFLLGKCYLHTGEYSTAEEYYTRIPENSRLYRPTQFELYILNIAIDKLDEARKYADNLKSVSEKNAFGKIFPALLDQLAKNNNDQDDREIGIVTRNSLVYLREILLFLLEVGMYNKYAEITKFLDRLSIPEKEVFLSTILINSGYINEARRILETKIAKDSYNEEVLQLLIACFKNKI